MTEILKIAGLTAFGLLLAACSDAPYDPIVDGQKNASYENDLTACRQLSLQQDKTNDGATGGAIVGGLIGGVEADDGDELGGMVAGAVVGGLIGSAEEGAKVEDARDRIVFN
ncbi:glycine zipper family protein [Roseobacter sp. EG26]|uniref:glycine zipper family protein n=1 Tax=Roseobacter sp. EG26 TaxID=3412477 RepID=UPI003CE53988